MALFKRKSPQPMLYGDGIHDDTKALQYLLDNERHIDLKGGSFKISAPLIIKNSGTFLTNGHFILTHPGPGLVVTVPATITNNMISGNGLGTGYIVSGSTKQNTEMDYEEDS